MILPLVGSLLFSRWKFIILGEINSSPVEFLPLWAPEHMQGSHLPFILIKSVPVFLFIYTIILHLPFR